MKKTKELTFKELKEHLIKSGEKLSKRQEQKLSKQVLKYIKDNKICPIGFSLNLYNNPDFKFKI